MARFRAENLILQEDQKVRFGVDYSNVSQSELWWDPSAPHPTTSGDLRLSSTISGVYPIYNYHLTTKQYVDDAIATYSGAHDDHNELNNIQGGTDDQYYHLTSAQHGLLTEVSGVLDASSQHIHDDRYFTESEITTISGDIITYVSDNYVDNTEMTTISGDIVDQIITDHGALSGLDDDDHPHYILVDGTRGFTGTVSGVSPTMPYHLTTKQYVDDAVYGLDWKDSVLDIVPIASGVQVTGNRYIASATGGGWTQNQIYEWDGSQWVNDPVDEGAAAWVEDEDGVYTFNGTSWVKFGNTVTHNNLSGLQGGTTNEYYHLTSTMYGDLTSFGGVGNASTEHIHDDRYFTEAEITTISGDIVAQIPSLAGYATETWVNNNFIDNSEMTTISGDLQTQIDGKDNYQYWTFAVEGTPQDNITSTDVLNFVAAGGISITRSAEDEITISGVSASGIITDHGSLTGLLDDDHPQYILVDGSGGFTSTVSGVYPTQDYHLTTKEYVDDATSSGIDRHGRTNIGYTATQIVVNFPDLGHTNYTVNATLENTTDSPPSIYAFIISAKTSSSFTTLFSGRMDSANYVLNWMIAED